MDDLIVPTLGESEVDARRNYYQICSKTVMDTTDPLITFDEDGVSNHWHEYHATAKEALPYLSGDATALERQIDKIKKSGRGKPFDCVVGVSGGVDSTYVIYLARQYGLRPLAVHFDNGWNSELAVRNIELALTKLNVQLHTLVVNWDEFRDLQLAYFKAHVIGLEIPTDHAIIATLYRIAAKHGIKYLLSGGNHVTEGILPGSWVYNALDAKNLLAIHNQFGMRRLVTFPILTLKDFAYYSRGGFGISVVRPLNLKEYNKKAAMNTIQDELGWEYYGGKHYESIFTRFYQSYILPKKFNIDKRRAHYSNMICAGQITREEALYELRQPTAPVDLLMEDKEYVVSKLGMTHAEFDAYIDAPARSHFDYANNIRMMTWARQVKKRLKITIR